MVQNRAKEHTQKCVSLTDVGLNIKEIKQILLKPGDDQIIFHKCSTCT